MLMGIMKSPLPFYILDLDTLEVWMICVVAKYIFCFIIMNFSYDEI